MNTATELRDALCKLFSEIKEGKADLRKASEMSNAAGKAIQATKLQLEYARLREERPEISFLK